MSDQPLENLSTMNGLGVIITKDLKWKSHIDKVISKANQRLWLTIRTSYDVFPQIQEARIHLYGTISS